jgi:hypothetical protein
MQQAEGQAAAQHRSVTPAERASSYRYATVTAGSAAEVLDRLIEVIGLELGLQHLIWLNEHSNSPES